MNAAVGNFRVFLDAIKSGRVAPCSVLIVESFDRISRQGIDEGYDLIKNILKAGILIVTLSPEREFDSTATKSLSKGALEIQLILERAAEESERKSDRVGRAWAMKQKHANLKAVTRKLPRWIVAKGGEGKKMKDTAPGEVRSRSTSGRLQSCVTSSG
jgi:DNA invertase Pin-like site-specific DNA recombinase